MAEAAVRFAGFGYRYPGREVPALTEIDLEVPAGELVLLAGPSGGGKSTLCRAIVGLVPHLLGGATAGSVTTLGVDVLLVPPHRLAGAVGYVFQNPEDQIVSQRVEHDIAFGPQNLGLPRAEIRARVDEALQLVGLEDLRHRPLDTLSAGQQQRIAIAGALALRPKLLVLDEPTSLLDPENARRVLTLVADLRRTLGLTLVIAEHRLEWCLPHADRVVLVENGRARAGTPQEIFGGAEPLPEYLNLPAAVRIARERHRWHGAVPFTAAELVAGVVSANGELGGNAANESPRSPAGETRPLPGPPPVGEGTIRPSQEERPAEGRASDRSPLPPGEVARRAGEGDVRAAGCHSGPSTPSPTRPLLGGGSQACPLPYPPPVGEGVDPPASPGDLHAAGEPLLELDQVSFRYPNGVEALRDVSVTLHRGETVGILGVSGSGKTTLAKHFNGLLRPTLGRVLLAGQDTARLPVSQLARRVGFVFQNPLHQLFADSVRAEIALGPRAAGLAADALTRRVDHALERLGVTALADRHPLSLSEGERRRIAIAAVLALQPDVLVLDEPTLGQDAVERRRLGRLVRAQAATGACTILITHEVEFAIDVCGRLLVVQDGRIVADGPPEQVGLDAELLEQAGLVPPQTVEIAGLLATLGITVAAPTVAGIGQALAGADAC